MLRPQGGKVSLPRLFTSLSHPLFSSGLPLDDWWSFCVFPTPQTPGHRMLSCCDLPASIGGKGLLLSYLFLHFLLRVISVIWPFASKLLGVVITSKNFSLSFFGQLGAKQSNTKLALSLTASPFLYFLVAAYLPFKKFVCYLYIRGREILVSGFTTPL